MKRYDFAAAAVEDLRQIARYTRSAWGDEQAKTYRHELELAFRKLSLNPSIGRLRDDIGQGLRSFRVAQHVAFYCSHEDGITVVRLLHPSMDVDAAFDGA